MGCRGSQLGEFPDEKFQGLKWILRPQIGRLKLFEFMIFLADLAELKQMK